MRNKICKIEKDKFLAAYSCYNWQNDDSLGEIIGLIPIKDYDHYEETPKDAEVFAETGIDGCHYCIINENENLSIYLIIPNMEADRTKYLIGHSITEFLSYILPIFGLFECVFDLNKDDFLQEVNNFYIDNSEALKSKSFINDLEQLRLVYNYPTISASVVYDRLKELNPLNN